MTEQKTDEAIRCEMKGEWQVVHLSGRLDAHLAALLEKAMGEWIAAGVTGIVFNLSATEAISSSGLQVFLATLRRLRAVGGTMRLCHMGAPVRKVLQMVSMEGMFQIHPTEAEALKAPKT